MNKVLLGLLVAIALLTSCKKEGSFEVGNGSGTGADGGGNYQPTSKGSYWKYKETGAFNRETLMTCTDQTKVMNGINYVMAQVTAVGVPGVQEGFFGRKDHEYYTFQSAVAPSTGVTLNITMMHLNDTAAIGYSWEHEAVRANGTVGYINGSIVEKGITHKVGANTFKDVIHTSLILSYDMPVFGKLPFITYEFYIAKNIGIIQIESNGDPIMTGGLKSVSNLTEYSIK
ncbi:hypothetical protein [Paraflavitalea pollutisoli]|uniref:hypothetical protein n=1 Tax=Paraflavitalea pollutisoli TaxID=3034143 RepID=UPI0023EABF8B|nr:hypothetical protein [Paraflavitalea sp. H1-2-19X]